MGFKEIVTGFKRELFIYQGIFHDPRTPLAGKIFLGLAIGYLCLPFDLIPDFIPLLGHLDDLVMVPLLLYLALRCVPAYLVLEYRNEFNRKWYRNRQ